MLDHAGGGKSLSRRPQCEPFLRQDRFAILIRKCALYRPQVNYFRVGRHPAGFRAHTLQVVGATP
jgi:hypothetical protein